MKRHDDWSFDCDRQTKSLYSSPSQAAATISSAKDAAAAPAAWRPCVTPSSIIMASGCAAARA
ncbi:hypothetical protein IG631_23406 [Alternaria alternata]|nr:hypothetical protein IG631_23406 [Alternaria alternata]